MVANACRGGLCEKGPGTSSQGDLPLPKAEAIRHAGDISVITYFRKYINCCVAAVKKSEKNVVEVNLQTPKSLK